MKSSPDWPAVEMHRFPGCLPHVTRPDAVVPSDAESTTYVPQRVIRERLRVAGYESIEALLLGRASDENGDKFLPSGADVERLTADIVAVFTAAFSEEEGK